MENVYSVGSLFPFFVKKIKSDFLFMRIVKDTNGIVRCMAMNCPKVKLMFLFSFLLYEQ